MEGEGLPRFGNRPRLVNDESGNGGRLVVGQAPFHGAVEVPNGHAAVHVDGTVRLRPHARHCNIVLVGDVADDLLEDVFERHQAHHLAVLVDHEGEWRLAPAKCLELL